MTQSIARERVMHSLLERQTSKYGDLTYMYFEDKEFSFKDFNEQANRVASGLQKLGIGKGDKVSVIMENCPETIFLLFGLSKLGAVMVPINISHRGEVMSYMVDHSDSSVLFMHSHFVGQLASILEKANKIESVVVLEEYLSEHAEGASKAADLIQSMGKKVLGWEDISSNDGEYQPADVIWSDPVLILYTSGTTGLSKGVLIPQNLLYSMAERYYFGVLDRKVGEGDCIYINNSLFHAHAWHAGINLALLCGAKILLVKKFSARRYWDDIKSRNCVISIAGGARLPILLLAEPKPDDADNSMKVVLGGPASEKLCNAFEPRFGAKIIEFYGSSELGMVMTNFVADRKLGACGKVYPGDFEVKLVDEDGVEVPPGTPGEILVRPLKPYMIMLEYYKMPDKTTEAWRDLWFHTGDNALIDDEGFYHFVDRKKDSIRYRGENISSFEVERVINSHPAVMESAAYPVKSEISEDDDVMVSVALKPGQSLRPEDLLSHCEGKMAYFMVPRYVRFMESLPKNAVLRVEKYKLRDAGVTEDAWDREKAGFKVKR